MKLTRFLVVAAVAATAGATPAFAAGHHAGHGQRNEPSTSAKSAHSLRHARSNPGRHLRVARSPRAAAPKPSALPLITIVPLPSPAAGHGAVWLPKAGGRWGRGHR